MRQHNCQTAGELLSAYYADRHEDVPSDRAFGWLRLYGLRTGRLDQSSFDDAERLIDSAVLDVEDLAQNFLGLDLYIDDLTPLDRKAGSAVFGFALPETGAIKVCMRAAEYLPLYRSTVAHEVAHVVLQHGISARTLCYSPGAAKRPPHEREADWFMSELLLPKPLLYLAIVLAGHPLGLTPREAFHAANTQRGWYQWRHFYFPFFVDRLQVSRELVAVRMSQLGFFDDSTSSHHRTYALPNRWRKPAPLAFGSIAERALPPWYPLRKGVMDLWCRLVPETLADHCVLESFVGGTLAIMVDAPSAYYELQQLFDAGLKAQLLLAGRKSGLRSIQTRLRCATY